MDWHKCAGSGVRFGQLGRTCLDNTHILPACLATFTDMVAPEDFACQDKLAVPNVASCVSLIESYGIVITL